MWCPRAAFGDDPPTAAGASATGASATGASATGASATGASASPTTCPELEAVVDRALAAWSAALDRGGLTARGLADVAEALDAVGQVVDLFAAAGRHAGNAAKLAAARSAARRAGEAIRRHVPDARPAAPAQTRPGSPDARPWSAGPTRPEPPCPGPPRPGSPFSGPAFTNQTPAPLSATSMTPPPPAPLPEGQPPTTVAAAPVVAAATASASDAATAATTAPLPAAARVLVVDDDHAHRDTLVRLLRLCGHQASAAADGEAALDAMRAAPPPHVVLLDMMMPGLTGADVLRAMGADPALRRVPVVVYSAAHESTARAAALDLGARDYLVKTRAGLDEIQAAITRYARAA